jgi:molybdopterin molybdotransferase
MKTIEDGARLPATDCQIGERTSVDDAFADILRYCSPVSGVEMLPVRFSMGRILAKEVNTPTALPRFDHAAMDGYGYPASEVGRQPPFDLGLVATAGAGEIVTRPLLPGSSIRLFTGSPVRADVAGVVMEERCAANGRSVTIVAPLPAGANIRRRGEDVRAGETIVEAGTLLDARHVAILTAAGVAEVVVWRRARVAVLSNGNELVGDGSEPGPFQIPDVNRPMMLALLESASVQTFDFGCHLDDPNVLARVFGRAAEEADVIICSGGVAGSEADHVARAVVAAGGRMRRFRLALKPGKPIQAGTIDGRPVLGLPGNPVAAMVTFLLFARPLVNGVAGLAARRPRGQPAVLAEPLIHAPGRTEFVPVRVTDLDRDGRPIVLKLGRSGSANLRPLVLADGLAEIDAWPVDTPTAGSVRFHPFSSAFAL